MIKTLTKRNNLKEIVEKKDINKLYISKNKPHVNLHEVIIALGMNEGVFLIYAYNATNEICVVIADWYRKWHSSVPPNIIFTYNQNIKYSAKNNTGTIAFDKTVNTIYVVPLITIS